MFKITNGKASAFNSPIIAKLFADDKRNFPIKDAFKLSELVQQINTKLQIYNDQIRKIISGHGGTIKPDGRVDYIDIGNQIKAQADIEELNKVEIELSGKKLDVQDNWPPLSLAEATILGAIINGEEIGKD